MRLLLLAAVATVVMQAAAAGPDADSAVAWRTASSDVEVDQAFALARQQGKPLFLYWGAIWCPPCNQVKAMLFSRPEFAERSRTFVPVYVDGDKAGSQKVAARFKVTGYPTMVLFKPDGTEITRLPGEVDPERYLLTLTAGLEAQDSVKVLAGRALSRQPLSEQQWRLLAFYAWDTDEQQVFKSSDVADKLTTIAAFAPEGSIRDRIALKAAVSRAQQDVPVGDAARAKDRHLVEQILANPASAMAQRDMVVLFADPLVKYLAPDSDARSRLIPKWESALAVISAAKLSNIEALDLLDARVDLWKALEATESLSPTHRSAVLAETGRIVSSTGDKYERQAVVPSAAHVLSSAGLLAESDAVLKSELARAVSPYYHMLGLASNAKKRGDTSEALRWYEEAWRKSEGPSTRLQWGVGYVRELVALAPTDLGRISNAARSIVSELDPKSETFYERNQRSLERLAGYLTKWSNVDAARARTVTALKRELSAKCATLPRRDVGRDNCERVFAAAQKRTS